MVERTDTNPQSGETTQPLTIEAASVPLSHQQDRKRGRSVAGNQWVILIGAVVGGFALVIATLTWLPKLLPQPDLNTTTQAEPGDAAVPTPTPGAGQATALPPFAQTQKALAQQRAQEQLKAFVEKQLELENDMKVGAWGQTEYDAALTLAQTGDERFVKEQFEAAMTDYAAATKLLDELIALGGDNVAAAIERGSQAITERAPARAMNAFDEALAIAPGNATAQQGRERARLLPQVIEMERKARNQELAGDWAQALATYEAIRALDPLTDGLEQKLASAAQGQQGATVTATLSEAFAALEARRYTAARKAFNTVLSLDPGNSMAAGGLEQIRQETELARIDRLEAQAATAAAAERWQEAMGLYKQALEIDPNIKFAKDGTQLAQQHIRADRVLSRIIANPEKLSNKTLLDDGQRILAEAKSLAGIGPNLRGKIDRVDQLLGEYQTPIDVQLVSDSLTNVLLSSVGELGRFDNKTIKLRPGAYTVIGSRDGCRDVRQQVIVRVGMGPIEIRCTEEL